MNMLPDFATLGGVIALILGFGFIIFVHELGHFLVAKAVGIKVTQFAIGFGHCLLAWRKGIGFRMGTTEPEYEKRVQAGVDPATLGETEYRLNYLPLGGYVKMLGQEDIDPAARSDDPRSYTSRPVWARMCVISAGVVMNLIFAMIFFIIAFMVGVAFPPAQIGVVVEGKPAAKAYALGHEGDAAYRGLKPGDRVLAVNGSAPMDFTDIMLASALSGADEAIHLTVARQGEARPLEYAIVPELGEDGLYILGVSFPTSLDLATLLARGETWPQHLVDAGVEMGMTATAVNGQDVENHYQLQDLVDHSRGLPVDITFTDKKTGKTATVAIEPQPMISPAQAGEPINVLGLIAPPAVVGIQKDSPAQRADLRPGDVIVRLGPASWPAYNDIADIVKATENALDIDVLRDGEIKNIGPVKPEDGKLGVLFEPALDTQYVSRVLADSPMAPLNLPPGSRILSVNDTPVTSQYDLLRFVAARPSPGEIAVACELNLADAPVETREVVLDEATIAQYASVRWVALLPFVPVEELIQTDSPIVAAQYGLKKTHQTMTSVYVTLARLVQGRVPVGELRGPLGIGHIGTQIARDKGVTYLIFFLGLISVNLAVVNFLPIPVVDGGHMVFLIAEKIKGSPVSPKLQIGATYIGLLLILCVFVMTFYFDVARLIPLITGG